MANGNHVVVLYRRLCGSVGCGENQVTVERGVRRNNGPGQPVMGRDGHALRLAPGEVRVGCDNGDGGVCSGRQGRVFSQEGCLEIRRLLGETRLPELIADLKREQPRTCSFPGW